MDCTSSDSVVNFADILLECATSSTAVYQIFIRVHNDNGEGRSTAVPICDDTTGEDLLDCVRDPGYTMVHLVARWQRKEILVLPTDNIVTLLQELEEEGEGSGEEGEEGSGGQGEEEGSGREVQFIVRYEHTDSAEGFRLSAEGRKWHEETPQTTGEMCAPQWLPDLPEAGATMTLADLQALAARQQIAMETQQQALVARETRLQYLQQQEARQQQLCSEEGRLRVMRERVEEQELKLKKLRALKGQVEQCRSQNGHLNTELEAVRALFSQKEKELALAVSRVDVLIKQLHDLREVKAKEVVSHGNKGKGDSKALTLELEKLRKELMQRNQINTQYSTRLAAQRQLLQQRKDQATKVDARIEELQQRLKKRRSQPPPPPPPPTQSQPSERGGEVGGWGRKVGGKVAAVEPNVQHPLKNVRKEDTPPRGGVSKPVSASPSPSPSPDKASPREGSPAQRGIPRPDEVNNNNKDRKGGGGGGEAAEEYKIPSIVSSHFDANRVRGGSMGKGAVSGGKGRGGEGVVNSGSSGVTSPGSTSSNTQRWTPVKTLVAHSMTPVSQPSWNTFGKPGSLPKWPPPAVGGGEGGSEPSPSSLHHPSHHPHINIFDEERQAGSGQSSPASSEGSGPLVKQGSGVFSHQSAVVAASSGPPAASTTTAPVVVQTPQKGGYRNGTESAAPSLEARGQHSGRQAPKPPPRLPQTVLHSKGPISLVSLSSASTVPSSSTSSSTAFSPLSNAASQSDSTDGGRSRMSPREKTSPQNSDGSNGSSSEQGEGGKVGSGIHLNQRPAPTYRYASKNFITNTYTSRLGSSALQRYHQLNQHLHTSPTTTGGGDGKPHTPPEGSTDSAGGEGGTPPSEREPSSMVVVVGAGEDGLTHFGVVGAPHCPDIASDKGSYKANTPKQVRRRHSDSDNEELAKVLKRGDRRKLEELTEDGANSGNTDPQPDPPKSSVSSSSSGSNIDSVPPSPSPPGGTPAPPVVSLLQKKTILKGDNRRKSASSNRVSFDPLALLLDASLEGELDLVRRTAREVDDVSRPNDEGITALHNAICAGHYHIVKFLIEFGADVNSPDSDGWTPLHCAASCNNLPMVRFLVEHGACLFATTISDHETAADKCEEDEDGYDHCSDYLYGVQEKLGIANSGAVFAVFDYSALKQDELSLHINDQLTVLRKGDEEEKEWWWAVGPDSREGYIPRNLLGLCPRVLATSYQPLQTSDC